MTRILPTLTTPSQIRYLSATETGQDFLTALPHRVENVSRENKVRVLGPAGDGATSVALEAVTETGSRVVLKFDPDTTRSAAAALTMAAWANAGVAPRVLADGDGWYMMDWVAGLPVSRPLMDVEGSGGPAVEALTRAWETRVPEAALVDRFAWVLPLTMERLAAAQHPELPAFLAERAVGMLPVLRSGRVTGTCHGDPVGGNILLAGGCAYLLDPVPHADSFEALVAHWAVRARDGEDALVLSDFMVSRSGVEVDADVILGWIGIHALTFAAYWMATGRGVPLRTLENTNVLR